MAGAGYTMFSFSGVHCTMLAVLSGVQSAGWLDVFGSIGGHALTRELMKVVVGVEVWAGVVQA